MPVRPQSVVWTVVSLLLPNLSQGEVVVGKVGDDVTENPAAPYLAGPAR